MTLRKIALDPDEFDAINRRDVRRDISPRDVYLDTHTGLYMSVYQTAWGAIYAGGYPETNNQRREAVRKKPRRYFLMHGHATSREDIIGEWEWHCYLESVRESLEIIGVEPVWESGDSVGTRSALQPLPVQRSGT